MRRSMPGEPSTPRILPGGASTTQNRGMESGATAAVVGEESASGLTMKVVRGALLVVAFYVLAGVVVSTDVEALGAQLSHARPALLIVALFVAQLPRPPQALSSLGASPEPLPFGPLYLLQLALGYLALVLPGGTARFAMNVRFFNKQGLPAGSALAVAGLDSAFWFGTQVVVLAGILLATPISLGLEFDGDPSTSLWRLVWIVVAVGVLSALVFAMVPTWRQKAATQLRRLWHDARTATRGLASWRRLGLLVGGNLLTEALFALTLVTLVAALGSSVPFLEALAVHLAVCLVAGLLPVPGGIGVVEAGIALGLTAAGVPEETAFATALLFRVCTFYLPPVWGVFAFRSLERSGHL